jgi:Flp pilus assembly pilin Flp
LGVRLEELRGQAGQTMAEYAVALSVITIIIVAALAFMSAAVTSTLTNVVGIL